MLNVWSAPTGSSLGTLQERTVINFALPTVNDITGVTFTVISGNLPSGLRIEGANIVGTTFEVSRTTISTFVIRASRTVNNNTEISDRTFKITVEGPDAPVWITQEGTLPVGIDPYRASNVILASRNNNRVTLTTSTPHDFIVGNNIVVDTSLVDINITSTKITSTTSNTITFFRSGANFPTSAITGTIKLIKDPLTFVLDGTFIDFQLQAADTDLRAGDELEYFIEENSGTLPPGLSLSRSGRITGFVDPILALDITARTGFYDSNNFDTYEYDFGIPPNIGINGYQAVLTPKKLNRYYEFTVTVTDGETPSRRTFKIFVVGDDFLRADNTILRIGSGTFNADSTYLRSPVWLSANNLGVKRANNYVTVVLNTFDPNPAIGPVDYKLELTNSDGSVSELPPGLVLDKSNGEIFGFIPYQPAITLDYKFTISAVKYDKENIDTVVVDLVVFEDTTYGRNFIRINKNISAADQELLTGDSIRIGGYAYVITSFEVTDQPYDIIRLDKNLQDTLPDGYIISKTYYKEKSDVYTTRKSSKTFTMQVLGEIDSVITWITNSDLGSIRANIASQLEIQAETTISGAIINYYLTAGTLPPGVELKTNGQLIGRVNQFGNIVYRSFWKSGKNYKVNDVVRYNNAVYKAIVNHTSTSIFVQDNWTLYTFANNVRGLTTFDTRTTTFDNGAGTLDRKYRFTVLARDQYRYSAISKEFTVFVQDPDVKLFSSIYAKSYPSQEQRTQYYTFINNLEIFTPDKIYRSSDPQFGVQTEIKMLVYAGIETVELKNYMPALIKNTKRKRMRIGSAKKAIAKNTGSDEVIYEIIYLEVFDEYEIGRKSAAPTLQLRNSTYSPIKVNQARINPVDGKLGTVTNGQTTYQNTNVESALNKQESDRYQPGRDITSSDLTTIKVSSNSLTHVYPSSIKNIRNNIKNIKLSGNRQIDTEASFLPQWMLTPQDNRTPATGYIKAIPLCYCKPGGADYILQNIEYYLKNNQIGFDFSLLDFEIDRFIIDSVSGVSEPQYLKLPNYKFNI